MEDNSLLTHKKIKNKQNYIAQNKHIVTYVKIPYKNVLIFCTSYKLFAYAFNLESMVFIHYYLHLLISNPTKYSLATECRKLKSCSFVCLLQIIDFKIPRLSKYYFPSHFL